MFRLCAAFIAVIAAATLAVSATSVIEKPPVLHGTYGTSYFILAVQKCSHSSPHTMHGLWPNKDKYSREQFCRQVSFNEGNISDLMPQMKSDWFSCPGMSSNTEFWTHEWTKHGSCAEINGNYLSEHAFFQLGLTIFQQGKWKEYCKTYESSCKIHVYPPSTAENPSSEFKYRRG